MMAYDDGKKKYMIKMYVLNFDKHPECDDKEERDEIHLTGFEKKWRAMNCRITSFIAFATLCLGLLAFCQGCASERTSFDYECAVRTCNIGPFEYGGRLRITSVLGSVF